MIKTNAQIDINSQEFSGLLSSMGYTNKLISANKAGNVMSGHFFHNELASGLSIHGADVIESDDALSSTQIPASLSFNILLSGQLQFSLGSHAYQLHCVKKNYLKNISEQVSATCAVSVLTKSELLSRKLTKGQAVRKVNLFIKRVWLEKRCTDPASKALLEKLFRHHGALYQWHDSTIFSQLAQQLLALPNENSLQTSLIKEQIAYTLLNHLLQELPNKIDKPSLPLPHKTTCAATGEKKQLRKKKNIERYIAKELENKITLPAIAKQFGLSVSSLQRYFKQTYKQTINEYIRQQRLEKAKIAISVNDFSISEAGYQAGYNHVSNFTSAFKKQFGITPASLLKLHQLDIDKSKVAISLRSENKK
ncbi:MAG: helix-turn-helix transcriptional regulator [Alteromonadales bacterium]|nr:helix-turn-helix transcriptional regulator [Alteromonadales bacterium]